MSMQRVAEGLDAAEEILSRPGCDPDAERQDWTVHRESLDALVTTVDDEILTPLEEALAELEEEEPRVHVRSVVADRVGDAAGLLIAARRGSEAQRLLQAACEIAPPGPVANLCAAGLSHPSAFARIIRAWWLMKRDRRKDAAAVAKGLLDAPSAIAESAQQIVDAPQPLSSPPSLFGINGFGLRVYGERDRRSNGSYVTTRYLTGLFVPLLPIDAYRVVAAPEEGWYFLAKEKLGPIARWWQRLALLGVVVAVIWGSLSSYYDSPEYRLEQAIEMVQAAEEQAGPDGREAVLDQYEAILTEFADQGGEPLRPAIEGFVRVGVAMVPSPLTVEGIGEAKRFVLRYRALPDVVRSPSLAPIMLEHLERWADELGTEGPEPILAALELLGHAEAFAPPSDTSRIRDTRRALNRELASGLAADWPLEAIRQYISMPEDTEGLAAAAELFDTLGEGPSVWVELAPTVQRWQQAAAGLPALASARERVLARLAAAHEAVADPERMALLEKPEKAALEAALEASPGDQELAVALAELELAGGDTAGALATLDAIGPPGRMVLAAQAALASAQAESGQEADADALLERVLASRLPAFESARRAYDERASSLSELLVARARRGNIPADLMRKIERAPESEQQRIFSQWLDEKLEADEQLSQLRDEYTSLAGVVGIAIQWGMLKLQRANAAEGEERQRLLDGAERAFLAISSEGAGLPSYHLGLGQVYYRLGKQEEGEREFANLLDDDPVEVQLAVGSAYRDLGLIARAREVVQRVYDSAQPPAKYNAAMLMAVMASDREDRRTWLRRGDSSSDAVRLELLDLDAREALEAGDYGTADAKFAEVSAGWIEQGTHDASASNNAALAEMARYGCTGDVDRLRDAVALLDQARSLEPDSALVVGNLASAVETLALVEILGEFMRPHLLRPSNAELQEIVSVVVAGPQRQAVRKAIAESKTLRRALELLRQQQVLGPRRPDAYRDQRRWYLRRDDAKALEQLARSLAAVEIDLSEEETAGREYIDGSDDEEYLRNKNERMQHYTTVAAEVERRGDGPTRSALLYLQAEMRRSIALMERDPDGMREAVALFARARAQWAAIDGASEAAALMQLAVLEAMKGSAVLSSAYVERWRMLGADAFFVTLLDDGGEGLAAVQARPELAQAAALRQGLDPDQPLVMDWVLGRLVSDAALTRAGQTSMQRPSQRISLEMSRALTPFPQSLDVVVRQLYPE